MGNRSSHSESIETNSNPATKPTSASSCPIMHNKSSSTPIASIVPSTPPTSNEGCPIKTNNSNAYKNPNQYNVSQVTCSPLVIESLHFVILYFICFINAHA